MKRDLTFFFDPRAIAIVGATAHANRGGNNLLKNLTPGYNGAIYHDSNVGGVIINLFAGMGAWSFDLLELMAVIKDREKPILTWLIGLKDALEPAKIRMEKDGWPVFNEIHRLVKIMSTVLQQR